MPMIRVPIGVDGPLIELGIWLARALAHALVARELAVHGGEWTSEVRGIGNRLLPLQWSAIWSRGIDADSSLVSVTAEIDRNAKAHDLGA